MIKVVVTTAGRQAIINAQETGTNAVQIAKIGVGTGKYTPSETQTALQAEIKQLDIIEGGTAGDNCIHVAYEDDSTTAYSVYEFGLFLTDGTLFAVYSSNSLLLQKTESSTAILAVDIALVDIDVSHITFGDVSFTTAAATTTQAGVIEIATDDEVTAGASNQLAITPQNIKALTATANRAGIAKLATPAQTIAGISASVVTTPAGVKAAIDDRLADDAETITGTDATKAVTPAGLSARTATTSRTGLVELATSAEAVAGTDNSRAVTPAGLWDAIEDSQEAATTSKQGLVELATNSEAMAGTDSTKAVTPAGVNAAITNFSGSINNAKVTATGSTTARTLADRFADGITPKDFGAKGDGTTNDTAAFTALEAAIKGRDVDLEGLTYSVGARFTANNYYNGYFDVAGVKVQPVYDFYKFGGTAHDAINLKRDFSDAERGGAAILSGEFNRLGSTPQAAVSSAIWDDVNRKFYTLHNDGDDGGVINMFSGYRWGAKVAHASQAYTTTSAFIGMQGLGIQYLDGGAVKLWASMGPETAGASVTSKGTKAVRFTPPTQNNQNIDNSVEIFNLFPEVAGSNQATTVCVSYSGKYLIARYNSTGNAYRIRVFKLADLDTAGDYSNKYINEFEIDVTRDTASGTEKTCRSIACDDRYIYFLAAGTNLTDKHSIYVTDMFGNVIEEYRDVSIGKGYAQAQGFTYNAPRSLFFMSVNGQPKLAVQFAGWSSASDRQCYLMAVNARQSYYFPTGSAQGDPCAVAIDEQGRITNAEGVLNFSVYPSGTSQYTQARVGANQMTLARFGADNLGSSIAFFKSRGAAIAESKSVLPSDVVGGLNFIVDNGNVDYETGQAIGASIGRIVGVVYPTSTITADGTTALGVRGAVRIYANSDGGTIEATKGLEVTDEAARPLIDKEIYLGTANRRWKAVYAMTDVINTSDRNEKQDIADIPDEVLDAWANVEYKRFRFIDDVTAQGANAPVYMGVIAQDVIAAFEAAGLDATDYGLIDVVTDEDGATHYGVRYSQVQIIEAAYIRKNGGGGGGGADIEWATDAEILAIFD